MKLATLLFGMVIFSIVTTLMFAAVQDILTMNKSAQDPNEWANLAGDYEEFAGAVGTNADSVTRGVSDATEQGAAGSQTTDVTLITGAVSGGRLATNFLTNFQNITNKVIGNVGTNYLDRRIVDAAIILVSILLVLISLHFIRGFKTET